jgi:hypothetical protein
MVKVYELQMTKESATKNAVPAVAGIAGGIVQGVLSHFTVALVETSASATF